MLYIYVNTLPATDKIVAVAILKRDNSPDNTLGHAVFDKCELEFQVANLIFKARTNPFVGERSLETSVHVGEDVEGRGVLLDKLALAFSHILPETPTPHKTYVETPHPDSGVGIPTPISKLGVTEPPAGDDNLVVRSAPIWDMGDANQMTGVKPTFGGEVVRKIVPNARGVPRGNLVFVYIHPHDQVIASAYRTEGNRIILAGLDKFTASSPEILRQSIIDHMNGLLRVDHMPGYKSPACNSLLIDIESGDRFENRKLVEDINKKVKLPTNYLYYAGLRGSCSNGSEKARNANAMINMGSVGISEDLVSASKDIIKAALIVELLNYDHGKNPLARAFIEAITGANSQS